MPLWNALLTSGRAETVDPLKLPKAAINRLGRSWIRRAMRIEAESQVFRRHNERAVEYSFVFREIARLCPKSLLDVGTGTTALPALIRSCGPVVTASDNVSDYWPAGMFTRHWHVTDDDIRGSRLPGGYEMVTCISVLEHIREHREAMREIFRLLAPGGYLVLTCPYSHEEFVENVYELPDARPEYRNLPYICRSYSKVQLDEWLQDSGATIVEHEFWRIETGRVHALGDWLFPAERAEANDVHQLACLLLRKG